MILQYSAEVMVHFENPSHVGELDTNASNVVMGIAGQQSGGDCIQLYLQYDNECRIVKAKFKAFGCVAAIACADKLADFLINKSLDEAKAITGQMLIEQLQLPKERYYCALLAEDAKKNALKKKLRRDYDRK